MAEADKSKLVQRKQKGTTKSKKKPMLVQTKKLDLHPSEPTQDSGTATKAFASLPEDDKEALDEFETHIGANGIPSRLWNVLASSAKCVNNANVFMAMFGQPGKPASPADIKKLKDTTAHLLVKDDVKLARLKKFWHMLGKETTRLIRLYMGTEPTYIHSISTYTMDSGRLMDMKIAVSIIHYVLDFYKRSIKRLYGYDVQL